MVKDLQAAGLIWESDGALGVFPDDSARGGDDQPMIVRKRDGGYGYAATDLATIRHRVETLAADRILYVVGAPQAAHLHMVLKVAKAAGWLPDHVGAQHVSFGTVLGSDGKPFRTRSGGAVKLRDLLDSAVSEARQALVDRSSGLDPAALSELAEQTGMAGVKYAELSTSRNKDYVFDPAAMVATQGDTGVYLQYAHARANAVLRKAQVDRADGGAAIEINSSLPMHPAERRLVLALDGFGDALTAVNETLEPQRLSAYMHGLARDFATFYEQCPVTRAGPGQRVNRLALCELTSRTMHQGLELLGIAAPESIGAPSTRQHTMSRSLLRAGQPAAPAAAAPALAHTAAQPSAAGRRAPGSR